MVFGYIRVSTGTQNIDRQLDALTDAGAEKIFIDKKSGKNTQRPELVKMFDCLRAGDKVIVNELSRFGRSVSDLIKLSNRLNEKGVEFQSLKENWIDTTTPQGKFFFVTTAAFDELTRDLIVANTKEGLQAARARGRKGGRPLADTEKIKIAVSMYKDNKYTIKQITESTGISQGTLYNYLKKQKKE